MNIIDPVDRKLLLNELTPDKFVRKTNNSNNDIYIFDNHSAPNLMREIGRLREHSFRSSGGGTGDILDIDFYDTKENPYKQLIVWDPDSNEILGGYRFFNCNESKCNKRKEVDLSTGHLFKFSSYFIENYLPQTIELGRSFVHPDYISGRHGRKGIFALDNLWDGLGALVVDYPKVKYFFGKVTMYPHFDKLGRDLILYFLNNYFPDNQKLVLPIKPLEYHHHSDELKVFFTGDNYTEDLKRLSQKVRSLGFNIPPLINAYMNLSPSMKCFGTALNDEFGDVEETGILITIADINIEKSKRHIHSYLEQIRSRKFLKKYFKS